MKVTLITASVIFIGLMLAGISYADFGPENIMAVWLLNEGSGNIVKDSSGNGNDGQISGAKWIDGVFGKALEFDGVDDFVEVPDNDTLDAELNDGFIIMVWTQMYNADEDGGVYSKVSGWEVDMCYVLNCNHGNNYEFAPFAQNGFHDLWLHGADVDENIWYHITATYDGDTVSIYYGGELVNSEAYNMGIADTGAPLLLGAFEPTDGFYNGAIDEFAIFSQLPPPLVAVIDLTRENLQNISVLSLRGRQQKLPVLIAAIVE